MCWNLIPETSQLGDKLQNQKYIFFLDRAYSEHTD